jgi:hypothetical protein
MLETTNSFCDELIKKNISCLRSLNFLIACIPPEYMSKAVVMRFNDLALPYASSNLDRLLLYLSHADAAVRIDAGNTIALLSSVPSFPKHVYLPCERLTA